MSIFFIQTCELQKSFLLGATLTFNYNECHHKVLLWRSFEGEIQVNFQPVGTYGQGDGLGPEGLYLHLHKTFASLQPYSWSQVFETYLGPL